MNNITLQGKLVADFKIQQVGDKKVAKATLSVPKNLFGERKKEAKEKGYALSDFPQIEIWGSEKYIDMINSNVKKDDKVTVKGSFQTGTYKNKEGATVYTNVVNVSEIYYDFKEKEEEVI